MTHLFDEFKNIKTFPARTQVYKDGIFMPEISNVDAGADLPLHIIHIGKITGLQIWNIDTNEKFDTFLTAKIETDGKTDIKIIVNQNIENTNMIGKLIIKNTGELLMDVICNNNKSNTQVDVSTKLFAGANSKNTLTGTANVPNGLIDADSNIGFQALCDPKMALLKISPVQRISSIPKRAEHSASIYKPSIAHIEYLKTAGISEKEGVDLLNKIFLEELIE